MKIAIPILNQRISPLLDSARVLVIFEIRGDEFLKINNLSLDNLSLFEKASAVKNANTDVLICGALSRQLFKILLSMNIETIAWKSGEVNEILTAFIKNNLFNDKYLMPGCCGSQRRCRLRGRVRRETR